MGGLAERGRLARGGLKVVRDGAHIGRLPGRVLRHTPRVTGDRARELWQHRESGEAFLVELEDERVLSADGPLSGDELTREALDLRRAAQGRSPAFTEEAVDLERRRHEFDRRRLEV